METRSLINHQSTFCYIEYFEKYCCIEKFPFSPLTETVTCSLMKDIHMTMALINFFCSF